MDRRTERAARVVFVVWAALSLCTLVTTSDLWTNLKLGEDIRAGLGFPRIERYSATAAGRPFIAYEWLSAVVFSYVFDGFGSPGLVALRVVVGLACLAFLYFAPPPAVRWRGFVLPTLMLTTYLLLFRTHVRPHLFTLLILSALVFALARWRRSGRPGELLWLIPLHALWANLHGAYLFGPVLLAGLAGGVAVMAWFPALQGDEERHYTLKDAGILGGVAVSCLVACLATPYGTALFEFSFRMSEASKFIKESIWEWASPFKAGPGWLWFRTWCAMTLLLWLAVVERVRGRHWIDLLVAAVVTYQAVRANRFIPYVGIFGFPIIVEAAHAHWPPRKAAERRWARLRPWLIAFMLATSVGPGGRFAPRAPRQIGLGFGPQIPLEEVALIESLGIEGVIVNEYGDGATIIHALYPKVRPVMDARIDVYGPELYAEWHSALRSPDALFAYADKYGADYMLLGTWPQNKPLLEALYRRSDWKLVHQFERRALYARVDPYHRTGPSRWTR